MKKLVVATCLFLVIGVWYFMNNTQEDGPTDVRYVNLDIGIAITYPPHVTVARSEKTNKIIAVKDIDNTSADYMHAFAISVYDVSNVADLTALRSFIENEVIPHATTTDGSPMRMEDIQMQEESIGNIPAIKFSSAWSEGFYTINSKGQAVVIELPYYLDPQTEISDVDKIFHSYQIIETLEIL